MNNKLKVLIVAPFYPHPDYLNGINKINANLLEENDFYSADILTPVYDEDKPYFTEEKPGPVYYKVYTRKLFKSRWFFAASWLFSNAPFNVVRIRRNLLAMRSKLLELAPAYDVIHLSSHFTGILLPGLPEEIRKKCILFEVDCLTMFTSRRIANTKNPVKRFLFGIEKRKRKNYEMKIFRLSRANIFVSDVDAKYAADMVHGVKTGFISNGVDIDRFNNDGYAGVLPNTLIFTGNFNYDPNTDAADFVINEMLPLLLKLVPDVKMYFAGINQSEEYRQKQNANLIFLGEVKSIADTVKDKSLYISPLEYGSGIKNKVLEAMSLKKVVIGSPVSFEGIEGRNGEEFIRLEKRDPKIWAETINEVLKNYDNYKHIGVKARTLIEKKYSWAGVRDQYGALYKKYAELKK